MKNKSIVKKVYAILFSGSVGLLAMSFTFVNGKKGHNSNVNQVSKVVFQTKSDTVTKDFYEKGINIPDKRTVYFDVKYSDSHKKAMPVSKRLLIVNDKRIKPGTSGGVENADYIIILDAKKGVDKYGDTAKYGVIEVFGENVDILAMPMPEIKGL